MVVSDEEAEEPLDLSDVQSTFEAAVSTMASFMGSPVLNAVSQGARIVTPNTPEEGDDEEFIFSDTAQGPTLEVVEEEDVKTEVRYKRTSIGAAKEFTGSTTSYIIVLSGVIVLLVLVVAGLCLYNRLSLAKRSLIKEAIHQHAPGEMVSGPDGHALEGQYVPKDPEKSAEFIADSCKRAAPSRNDTVSKLFTYTMDVDY